MGKLMTWLGKRPTLFAQKPFVKNWPDQFTRDLGKSPKPMSILSGPEHPVLLQRVRNFRKRFRSQGFFGMSTDEASSGLIGGLGLLERRQRSKRHEKEGFSIIG